MGEVVAYLRLSPEQRRHKVAFMNAFLHDLDKAGIWSQKRLAWYELALDRHYFRKNNPQKLRDISEAILEGRDKDALEALHIREDGESDAA